MKHGGRMGVGATTYYNGFGGAPRDFNTVHNTNSMPTAGCYMINGTGRDTYISMSNGGFFKEYHPDLHPIRGTIGFGEPRRGHSSIKAQGSANKKVQYYPNGGGRDAYIS
tara:strand:+ start:84 stop:413 length:330 start_codon:yes stop_codon:yes gene_type:complete